jgi:DNA-binding NtrC family response regulator
MARASVLLVEDEDAVRGLLARALRAAGHDVTEAASVSEGIELARRRSGPFDLLCVDGILRDGSGQRVIDAVQSLHPGPRVLVCSGHLEEDVLRKRITAGAYAFLAKPYSGPELVRKVEEVLVGPAPAQLPES